MASAAAAASRQTSMLQSLLSARGHNSSIVRSLSLLAPSAQRPSVSTLDTASDYLCTRQQHRLKHVSVTHATSYTNAINSQHGHQLNLALEESRGKDDGPFDPFSQFLDLMGHMSEDGNDEGMEVIEDAEFEEIDEEVDEDMTDDVGEENGDDNNTELETIPKYTTTGALFRPKSQRYALRAGYPAGGKFAVIQLSGFQHKVTPDDLLVVNKLKPVTEWSVGSTHTLKDDDVLLVADQNQTLVGLPGVKGAQVEVMVEEITRDKTVVVFKKRRRKHSRRKNGHRRQVTFLRVLNVKFPDEERGDDAGDLNDINAKAAA